MTHILELTLTGIAHGGEALGRHDGKVIFVPYAIPGETVRVEVIEAKANWARARLLAVLTPSPDRVEPPCPFFGPQRCGGCQWQHIAYERQLELKQTIVRDQLARLGRLTDPPVAETWAVALTDDDDLAWRYRNHVQFNVTADGKPAFQRANSHDLIAVDECLLLSPALDALHAALWAGATTDEPQIEPAEEQPPTAASYKGKLWTLGATAGDRGAPALRRAGTPGSSLRRLTLRSGAASGQTLLVLETSDGLAPELALDLPVAVACLLYTSPSPRDRTRSRMPSSA